MFENSKIMVVPNEQDDSQFIKIQYEKIQIDLNL